MVGILSSADWPQCSLAGSLVAGRQSALHLRDASLPNAGNAVPCWEQNRSLSSVVLLWARSNPAWFYAVHAFHTYHGERLTQPASYLQVFDTFGVQLHHAELGHHPVEHIVCFGSHVTVAEADPKLQQM